MGQPETKYARRVQTMLTEQQYDILREYAEDIGRPLSVIIREEVVRSLIADLEQRRKQRALDWMASQELPVADWEVMEREIESRWEERSND